MWDTGESLRVQTMWSQQQCVLQDNSRRLNNYFGLCWWLYDCCNKYNISKLDKARSKRICGDNGPGRNPLAIGYWSEARS